MLCLLMLIVNVSLNESFDSIQIFLSEYITAYSYITEWLQSTVYSQ